MRIVRRIKQSSPAIIGNLIKNQKVTMGYDVVNDELRVTFAVKRKKECNDSYLNALLKKRLTMANRCLAIGIMDIPETKRRKASQLATEMWKLMLEDKIRRHGIDGIVDIGDDMKFQNLQDFMEHVSNIIMLHPNRDAMKEMFSRIAKNPPALLYMKDEEVANVESETKTKASETTEKTEEIENSESVTADSENTPTKDEGF